MNSSYFQTLEIEEQNDIMSSILSTLPAAILLFDKLTNKHLFASRSVFSVIGYTCEELFQMDRCIIKELIHPEDHADYSKAIEAIDMLLPGEMVVTTQRLKDKMGDYRWFINKTLPFKKVNKKTSIILCIVRDIDAEVKNKLIAEKQIDKISKASYALSHNLRHEHAKVLGIVRTIKEETVVTKEDFKMLMDAIKVSVEKIDYFIRSLNNQLEDIKEQIFDFNFGTADKSS